MKTIFVPLTGYANDAVALMAAYLVARRFKGRIEAQSVQPDAMQMAAVAAIEQFSPAAHNADTIHALEARAKASSAAAFAAFEEFLKVLPPEDSVETALRQIEGEPVPDSITAARFCDLTVIGRAAEAAHFSVDEIANILVGCGRPVLIVPGSPANAIGTTIAIAWKETAEAARAVTGAMPFLLQAERVVVITASENDRDAAANSASAEHLAGNLRRHGIDASARTMPAGESTAAQALLDGVRKVSADLLVMGAYGHGRLHELVFGGFTRELLQNGDIPVLMVH